MKSNAVTQFLSLTLSLALLSAPLNYQARAADGKGMAVAAQVLGGAMAGIAAVNMVQSAVNCANISAATANPPVLMGPAMAKEAASMPISGSCALAALNAAAMAAALASMFMNKSPESALDGQGVNGISNPGSYDRNFDPNTPIASIINCPAGQQGCDCSGASASSNPLCGPEGLKNSIAAIDLSKKLLSEGVISPPDGQSLDSLMADIDKANKSLSDLASGKAPSELDSGNLGESVAGSGPSGSGKEIGAEITGGGSGGFDDPFGANKGKAGPADRSGLGKASFANGLDMIDDESGKSITLWQRLTRRMQGNQAGDRAFLLAKMEYMRKVTSKSQTLAQNNPPPSQTAPQIAANTPAPSAPQKVQTKFPSRAPASTYIKPKVTVQH